MAECRAPAAGDRTMPIYTLTYDVVDDFVNRRQPFRQEHLEMVRAAHARGDIVLAGALGDPPDGALLIFRGDSPSAVEEFARQDPYVTRGLVTRWQVRPWNVVVGNEA
jgi:uncharacterized protein